LKRHMLPLAGYESDWECVGEAEAGRYKGQMIFWLKYGDPRFEESQASWVPEEDLVIIAGEVPFTASLHENAVCAFVGHA
jgi:hypothetical protein